MVKNKAAVALGRLGGKAKAKLPRGFAAMDPKRLSGIARKAAAKRWKKPLAVLALAVLLPALMAAQGEPAFIPRWPGNGPIRYVIDSSAEAYRPEILTALNVWGRELLAGSFVEVQDPSWNRTIVFRVAPFGPGNTFLAMSMYPAPLIVEPWAGDVTLNSDAGWNRAEMRSLLVPLLIHEIGHALGMGHSWQSDSVMFPNIDPRNVQLGTADRRLFWCLYNGVCR
jgi:hypothetical protein